MSLANKADNSAVSVTFLFAVVTPNHGKWFPWKETPRKHTGVHQQIGNRWTATIWKVPDVFPVLTNAVKMLTDEVTKVVTIAIGFLDCQLFQNLIYRMEKVLVKSGNFTVELAKVLVILRKVSGKQGPGLQQDSIMQQRV